MNYTKEQLDYDIEHCLTAQTLANVGAYRVSFRPFENTLTEEEQAVKEKIERGDEAIESCYDDLLIFVEHLYSTVYHGYRWYFETPEKLQAFCKVVGAGMSKQKFKVGQVVWGFVFGRLVSCEVTNVFEEGLEVTFTADLVDFDTVSLEIEEKDVELYPTEEEARKARGKTCEKNH